MSPRKYDNSRRAAAAQATRRRIAQATLECHGELGVAGTSWEDIARRAGVSVGTVYRHFPTLDELLPACGTLFWQELDLPGLQERAAARAGDPDPLRGLVGVLFGFWAVHGASVEGLRTEAGIHPLLRDAHERVEAALDAAVRSALGADLPDRDVAVVRALAGPVVHARLAERGLPPGEAADRVARAVRAAL